jgi:cyanate permease
MPLTGFSWRLAFVFYGAVTFVMALVWLVWARDQGQAAVAQKPPLLAVLPRFVRVTRLRLVFVGGMLAFATSHGLSNWLPKLFEGQGMAPAEAGVLASVPMFVGIFAVLLVPALTAPRFRGAMVSCLAVVNCLAFLMVSGADGGWRLLGLVCFGIAGFSIFPLLTLLLMDTPEVGPEVIGMASGVFFAVAEIGGFSSPLVIGALYDLTGTFLAGIGFLVLVNLSIFLLGLRLRAGGRIAPP